jgi:tetratricopeptide (TPR) repeat protein
MKPCGGPAPLLLGAAVFLVAVPGAFANSNGRLPTKQSPAAITRAARDHYERGMKHYNLGEFEDAIAEFKQAYALSSAPALLFNLAQASRLKKDYEQALQFYRTYLRLSPNATNRADAEGRIAELDGLLKARAKEKEREAVVTPEPPAARPVETPAPAPPPVAKAVMAWVPPPHWGRRERSLGLALAGGGAASLIAAVGLGLAAKSAESELDRLASTTGTWSDHYKTVYQQGQAEAAAATALYIVGGAALVGGTALAVVGIRRERLARQLSVVPTRAGAQLVLSCAF